LPASPSVASGRRRGRGGSRGGRADVLATPASGASVRIIFVHKHYGDAGNSIVVGASYGLEAHQRRGPRPVVVADVQGERHDAAAVAPADGQPEQFDSAGRSPARLVFRTVRETFALIRLLK
jgi:hypothetical protein